MIHMASITVLSIILGIAVTVYVVSKVKWHD